jgi:hypothetical protein
MFRASAPLRLALNSGWIILAKTPSRKGARKQWRIGLGNNEPVTLSKIPAASCHLYF